MLSKIILRSRIANKLRHRFMSSYSPAIKEPHMNDIPVPHEPFEKGYKRRQVENNVVLVVGITFFLATLSFVSQSGVLVFNPTPPKKNLSE